MNDLFFDKPVFVIFQSKGKLRRNAKSLRYPVMIKLIVMVYETDLLVMILLSFRRQQLFQLKYKIKNKIIHYTPVVLKLPGHIPPVKPLQKQTTFLSF